MGSSEGVSASGGRCGDFRMVGRELHILRLRGNRGAEDIVRDFALPSLTQRATIADDDGTIVWVALM